MRLGSQIGYSEANLRFVQQMGVTHVDSSPRGGLGLGLEELGYWDVDKVIAHRKKVESFGLTLEAMHMPLSSAGIAKVGYGDIMMAGPKRDENIAGVCKCIEAAAKAGVPTLLYNLAILPVVRTPYRTPGRGGITYSHFDYEELKDAPDLPYAPVTAEMAWERIAYFLERVIPCADKWGVNLGCHQHDPGMPSLAPYRGITRVLGSLDGVKKFIAMSDSPRHGLNFCQGTISEMCTSPEQVYDTIRYFASRKRVFWVHFRNIRGGMGKFEETFPDEGDIDMITAMRTWRDAGYEGTLVPDHVPQYRDDSAFDHKARAFSLGYIRAALQAVESEI